MRRVHFHCPGCGPHVAADEDGCCATCGRDCAVEACKCTDVPPPGELAPAGMFPRKPADEIEREACETSVDEKWCEAPHPQKIQSCTRRPHDDGTDHVDATDTYVLARWSPSSPIPASPELAHVGDEAAQQCEQAPAPHLQLTAYLTAHLNATDMVERLARERDEARACGATDTADACGACIACYRAMFASVLQEKKDLADRLAAVEAEREVFAGRLAMATRFLVRDVGGRRRALLRRLVGTEWIVSDTYEDSGWYFDGRAWVRWPEKIPSFPTAEAAFAALSQGGSR